MQLETFYSDILTISTNPKGRDLLKRHGIIYGILDLGTIAMLLLMITKGILLNTLLLKKITVLLN